MPRTWGAGRLLAVAALAICALACRKKGPAVPEGPPLHLGEITIQTAGGDAAIDDAALAQRLRALIEGSGLVVASADGGAAGPSVRVLGRVASETVEAGHKGLCRAAVSLTIATRPSDTPGALNDELSAGGEEQFEVGATVDRRAIAARLIERTASDLLGSFLRRARLRTASAAELHAALIGDAGAPLREEAIRQIGARHLDAEAPALLTLLDDPEETTRDAALGALIVFKDKRAVTKLTRDRSLRDRHEMLKLLDAISLIGGEEAAEYLAFVADSHDDPDIRQAAREARDRLQRRIDAGALKP